MTEALLLCNCQKIALLFLEAFKPLTLSVTKLNLCIIQRINWSTYV